MGDIGVLPLPQIGRKADVPNTNDLKMDPAREKRTRALLRVPESPVSRTTRTTRAT